MMFSSLYDILYHAMTIYANCFFLVIRFAYHKK